jgi:3-deoxy-7-phosphoheptulonate synthase
MNEFSERRQWGPVPKIDRVKEYVNPLKKFTIIAGPCSVENETQIWSVAKIVSKFANHLRGGVFRAGTYPGQNFGWVSRELLTSYRKASKHYKIRNIIEVLDYRDLDFLHDFADCYQVGCRQMQNYTLLRLLGQTNKAVFLKRHPGATIDEFLGAAEHLLAGGVRELYLIERGSATNATHCRWDLSVSMIPAVKSMTNIPIIVDASHGTGRRDLVGPMTLAGVAAGADGLLVETHPDPKNSLSDHDQAISFKQFEDLMFRVEYLRKTLGELPDEMPVV